jgi:hypothetical protein
MPVPISISNFRWFQLSAMFDVLQKISKSVITNVYHQATGLLKVVIPFHSAS